MQTLSENILESDNGLDYTFYLYYRNYRFKMTKKKNVKCTQDRTHIWNGICRKTQTDTHRQTHVGTHTYVCICTQNIHIYIYIYIYIAYTMVMIGVPSLHMAWPGLREYKLFPHIVCQVAQLKFVDRKIVIN